MTDAEGIWADKTDDELLEAGAELSEYTEDGERIIRAELQRRGLPAPDPPLGKCSRCGKSIGRSHSRECSQCGEPFPQEILQLLGGERSDIALELVLRTGDAALIPLAKSLLEAEGIEYLVRGENLQDPFGARRVGGYNYITGVAEFLVHPDDAERARTVLEGLPVASTKNLVSITPFFIVKDLQASIKFYRERLGFQLDFQGPEPDVYYARVSRDGIGIMLKTISAEVLPCPNHTRHAWARWDAYIHTLDPDVLFDEFRQHDVRFVKDLSFIDAGLWGFEIADADGYVLAFFNLRDQ